jgi:hypothetical protein
MLLMWLNLFDVGERHPEKHVPAIQHLQAAPPALTPSMSNKMLPPPLPWTPTVTGRTNPPDHPYCEPAPQLKHKRKRHSSENRNEGNILAQAAPPDGNPVENYNDVELIPFVNVAESAMADNALEYVELSVDPEQANISIKVPKNLLEEAALLPLPSHR